MTSRILNDRLGSVGENIKVLLVGLGGLGCPTALMLTRAGIGELRILDDDVVETSNLHRQVLFSQDDVGQDKLLAGVAALKRLCPDSPTRLNPIRTRLLPDNARELIRDVDVVVEGSDNFATKFLCADTCILEKKPVIQGAAVRFITTALSSAPMGRPCYRCLFEDLPRREQAPNCAEAGVLGSVVGFGAALMAELALRVANGCPDYGFAYSYDARLDRLRRHRVFSRENCALCGHQPQIVDISWSAYMDPHCESP
jgi:molybdopterin/thiamine biosynthesis adenylyltransferase